jgi:hypothetical protein
MHNQVDYILIDTQDIQVYFVSDLSEALIVIVAKVKDRLAVSCKSQPFLTKFLPDLLLGVSVGYCRALVDESAMIRTQMGNTQ